MLRLRLHSSLEPAADRRALILHDPDIDELVDPALPVWEALAGVTRLNLGEHATSAGRDLVTLLLALSAPHGDLPDLYRRCLESLVTFNTEPDSLRLHSAIARRLTGESERLPATFVNDTLKELAKPQSMEDETRIALLACACRQLTRPGADETLSTAITLLLRDPSVHLSVPTGFLTTLTTESALAVLYDTYRAPRPRTWLLRTAIHLGLHTWCKRLAARILREDSPDLLTPSEADYLHPLLTPQPSDPTSQPPTPPPPPPPIPPDPH
ncbi:hypothetical protein [Streptomyces acidiscabies]|uniref:Uncharacterized protein n=1 Tax=Streptomyces acidiscabies TaxID=42234 RepID=A0A0L0KPA6_9ACTN|nr:hypothetical protein [Streptomyces acidiscabies]KND40042.1 hypothetical protein IQ63_00995 [Streptomyces acidiscabies]